MPKRPPCHSHSSTATMIGCHHTAISAVTHHVAVHRHTTHTGAGAGARSHTEGTGGCEKSAAASATLTTKSLLSLQLFLHRGLTTHQKSLSLWEQHETAASSPLGATRHIKYLIICFSIFPIKSEVFSASATMCAQNIGMMKPAGRQQKRKRKKKKTRLL